MKKIYSRLIITLLAITVFLLNACSFTEEQETPEPVADTGVTTAEQKSQESGKPEGDGTAKAAEASAEQGATQVPEQPEPVVEVIPSQAAGDEELQVEPIQKPAETPAPEEQAMAGQSQTDETASSGADRPKVAKAKTAEEIAVASDTEEPPGDAGQDIPVSTGPNHFVITAAKKNQAHPHFGKGHPMGFLVNNVQGREIVLERGQSYRFDVATDPKHDVYISLKEIGWGSTPYSEGIQGMYTYKGTMTIDPTEKTPDVLFYSCRNHPYMGGKIHVVNPGETVEIAKTTTPAESTPAKTQKEQVTEGDVNQKIMFADMLLKSKNSQTVLESHISEAIQLHKKAQSELQAARASLKGGNNNQAYEQAENAVALIKKSTRLVPNESALEQMKERYDELQASIDGFEKSHKENYDRITNKQGEEAAVDYDRKAVAELITSAEKSAKQGDYLKANRNLEKAQRAITVAIHKMLNNQTIVIDLNFETAEEEYEYELRRFKSYEELIPIAVEQKKPKAGAKKLMESFVKKGTDLRDRAVKAAQAGDYPTAIAMLHDATKDVRRGLRMIGVMQ